ncbi:phosphotransferase [bacterium]|nr:phosphotransferase [bacterium]
MDDVQVEAFSLLLQRFVPGGRLLRSWRMSGGVSAEVTALEYETENGERHRAVARRHGPADLTSDPQIAEHEFRLLRFVTAAGIPAPTPLWVDGSCDLFETPILVVSFLDGEVDLNPVDQDGYLHQLAVVLAQVHAIDISHAALDFLPRQDGNIGAPTPVLDTSLRENEIRAALASMPPQRRTSVLLHGDFWPGNVLWRAGQLTALIDWEDAAVGDPLADVANARLEILWAFGQEAMDQFTTRYQAHNHIDFDHLPYWDLRAALRPAGKLHTWGLDPPVEKRMRSRHRSFVQRALKASGH